MHVRVLTRLVPLMLVFALVLGSTPSAGAATRSKGDPAAADAARIERIKALREHRVTQEQREAAAARAKLLSGALAGTGVSALATALPGGTPNYFGPEPNWLNSPPMRKFVDGLPGLGAGNANNLGQYIPVANPDTTTYPGSDYYVIALREYTEQMHSDLPPTTLRGYVQVNNGTDADGNNTIVPAPIHYLGPIISATKDRPVRVKFINELPTGTAGDLFLPVDTTVMGAGMGPYGMDPPVGDMNYTQNRATIHLHGGRTPWISDGLPHQWITPAGEFTSYPKGVSVRNVPDMPDPGDGSQTFFYSNQQSARLMFYHDHSFGITRLNVYAGEAAGYLISDPTENKLVADGILPSEQIPLIIQDKTFVPDPATVTAKDPTWDAAKWGGLGNLWLPHVYMPNQNPNDSAGVNAMGRWDYGPWIWPPFNMLTHGPVTLADGTQAPGTPDVSMGMETFMDTPLVNGTAYPVLKVKPKAYRFRILNAANDRFWNLGLYYAKSNADMWNPDGSLNDANAGEIPTVTACLTQPDGSPWPDGWPTPDLREGGVPDPKAVGPDIIQIASESGFLPAPVVIPSTPIGWDRDPKSMTVGNILEHGLFLGPAERADVVVDFSAVPAGSKLILYNDAPAAVPARDPRYDYYTGNADNTDTGGNTPTQPGYGPNVRTVIQIQVEGAADPGYDLTALQNAFASSDTTPGAFASSQDPIIVPQTGYDSAYNATFPADKSAYVRIHDTGMSFKPMGSATTLTLDFNPKAIAEEFETDYGRMSGFLGVEVPFTNGMNQTTIWYNYQDPTTEFVKDSMTPLTPVAGDGTQIWKITHNGVDTHAIHFHEFDVQLVNRVDWAGVVKPPEPNELGWKETVRMNPLEDTIVALRPVAPKTPFGVPDSIRPLDPVMPLGSTTSFRGVDPNGNPVAVTNQLVNFGWEYMWHCHLLSHEEMNMMRPISLDVASRLATPPVLAASGTPGASIELTWTDATPVSDPLTLGNPANEVGFRVERATYAKNGTLGAYVVIGQALANQTSFVDTTTVSGFHSAYRYRVVAYNAAGDSVSNNVLVGEPFLPPIRVAGADRYATAVSAAAVAFPSWSGVQHVVVASGEDVSQVDALAAAGLAGAYDAPLLLTAQGSLPAATRDALIAMPDGLQVHVVGGISAVGSGVLTAIVAVPGVASVERVPAGPDRYATAANVAARMKTVLGGAFPTSAFVVNGANSANLYDALTASPASFKVHYPVLLVNASSVPPATSNAISTLGITRVYIVGGTTAVSNGVAGQLGVAPGDRISGANRYATAVAFAQRARSDGWLTFAKVGIAANSVDALAAGPTMGRLSGPMLLTSGTSLSPETAAFLTANKAEIKQSYVFGGTVAINAATYDAISLALQ